MTALDITTLEASVEALIRQQVAAYEAGLREALGRRLAAGSGSSPRRRGTNKPRRPSKGSSPAACRRTPEELEALAERFFAAVESAPGETMVVLAQSLGLGGQELQRPVLRLRAAGRIKTVGERSRTRYYPMTAAAT